MNGKCGLWSPTATNQGDGNGAAVLLVLLSHAMAAFVIWLSDILAACSSVRIAWLWPGLMMMVVVCDAVCKIG